MRALAVAAVVALSLSPAQAEGETRRQGDKETRRQGEGETVNGVRIELSLSPTGSADTVREQGDAAVRFRLTDAATGTPLSGVAPAAWIEPVARGDLAATRCVDRVEQFLAGTLLYRPAVDLNTYQVLALNGDATVSVVDPLFGFGGTKLLAMVELASPGEDWALLRDKSRLFVSQPEAGRLAVIDTASWKVAAQLDVGEGAGRLALQDDGAFVWVAVESGVVAVDTNGLSIAARLATGQGPHDLALAAGRLFVTNRAGKSLTVIDTARQTKVTDVALGGAPSSVTFSALAGAAYVVSEEQGTIVAVDAGRSEVTGTIQAEPGLAALRFAPGSRLGFVPNPKTDRVHLLDAAKNRIVQTAAVHDEPDQVSFTDHLAYVRHRGSEIVLMIPLDQVGEEGKAVPVVDFPGGQNPPGKGSRPTPAEGIVRAPGATAVLVANAADRAIYFYKEGMAAPMGSFRNYGREPRAVMVVDRSLKERSPGSYETVARMAGSGRQRVAFFLDAPRVVHCFEVEVAPDPGLAARRAQDKGLTVQPLLATRDLPAGRPSTVRFRLSDAVSGEPVSGLTDVSVLVQRSSGTWHARLAARSVGEGIYETEVAAPAPGSYYLFVQCLSQGLAFHRSPRLLLRARAEETPEAGR